jgi:hypothetical protein
MYLKCAVILLFINVSNFTYRYDHVKNNTAVDSQSIAGESNYPQGSSSSRAHSSASDTYPQFQQQRRQGKASPKSEHVSGDRSAGCQPLVNNYGGSPTKSSMTKLNKAGEYAAAVKSQPSKLSAKEWATASEFIPGQPWKGISK